MNKLFSLLLLLPLLAFSVPDPEPMVVVGHAGSPIPLAFENEPGIRKAHATWIGINADKMALIFLPRSEKWTRGSFTITPKKGGRLKFELKAGAVQQNGKDVAKACLFDEITVNGKPIRNSGAEEGESGFGFYRVPKARTTPGGVLNDPRKAGAGNACLAAWNLGPVSFVIPVEQDRPVTVSFLYRNNGVLPPLDQRNEYVPLSLTRAANMGCIDEKAGDGKGGWTDQGPGKDLRSLSSGLHTAMGVPFLVADPGANDGRNCVVLKSIHSPFGSSGFTLPVNRICNRIALMTGSAWAEKGHHAADVRVRFADGRTEEFPLVTGKNLWEWTDVRKRIPEGALAWSGTNPDGAVGLYACALKLKQPGRVRDVTIRPVAGTPVVTGIFAVTAAMVRNETKSPAETAEFRLRLDRESPFIALPLDLLIPEMRKKKFPVEEFFRDENLPRIRVLDAKGRNLTCAIARFQRKLSPVILIGAGAKPRDLVLKLGATPDTRVLPPAEALKQIRGSVRNEVDDAEWKEGILLRPRDAELRGGGIIRDADSFYREAIDFEPENTEAVFTFELDKPRTVKLFANLRHPAPKSQANRVRASIDGKPFIIVGGVYYKSLAYFWTGGERVSLSAGKHTIRLWIPAKKEERKGLELASFYLGFGFHAPESAGFADEMEGLRKAGFEIFGDDRRSVAFQSIPSKDRLSRILNPSRSWPDLSSLVNNAIDRRGALRPDGNFMRFSDGTELPFLWGRNIDQREFYELWKTNRLGSPDGEGIDRLMKRYKELGISSLRIFFSTMPDGVWSNINNIPMSLLDTEKVIYRPDYLELFQRLIGAAHKHGLYLKITFGAFSWELRTISQEMQAMFYHPEMIARRKKIMEMLLNPPNPFRNNIRPADDPTVLILEIENECNFLGGGFGRRALWQNMKPEDRNILYPIWHDYLKRKYATIDKLREQWGRIPLIAGKTEVTFDNIEFPPTGDASKWGNDSSGFQVKMDDLRVTEATFGRETTSDPVASEGFEFMYELYSSYLRQMRDYLRSLGFRGIITTCGPDTENYYVQRAAANRELDAVSGGTGYWNRTGYGFLKSLSWLAPLVYAAAPDKPVIAREYGPNLACENSWWGCLITAAVQKSVGQPYLYDFSASIPGPDITPDYLYPEDAHEQRSIDLLHEMHFHCTMANLAAAIAVRSEELTPPPFRMEIAYPLDHVFYAAPFRGLNRMTFSDFVPFLYTATRVRTYEGPYRWNADLVVNEPSIPSGDFSKAKHLFRIRPHSLRDRWGKPADSYLKGKTFSAEGFLDTQAEKDALYDAIVRAGAKMPVTKAEFCKVWRDWRKKLEIDTGAGTFRGETSTWGAFIGDLAHGPEKAPKQFRPSGSGDAWSFFGRLPAYDLFLAVMNGTVDLHETSRLTYLMLGSSDLTLRDGGKTLIRLESGSPVNVGFKTEERSLASAKKIFVTFYRTKSCQLPATVTFGRRIRSVTARNRDGAELAKIPHTEYSFQNLWRKGHLISYYEVVLGE